MTGNFVVHRASGVTGINLHITLAPVSAEKPLQLGPRWRGKGRPGGVIGLEGGELHHNGTQWRSLLIWRKDQIANRSVRTIRRLCAASLVGSILVDGWQPDAEPDRPEPASSLMAATAFEPDRAGHPTIAHALISLCYIMDWQS